ncbi:hypothetical protein, partial [Myroides marinus]|uniref:hypothetical protein n=1 Tax=Myroides marinus TaxID=703342 RepID=UPI002581FDF6|nr:hypothetical protein [Myroides marinus]MDM1388355.1 hypothetical protein [Myroides marinus]MDM1395571.1 hypothetical protein [Myroides marinus]
VATVNADGTVTYQTISAGSLVDSKKVTTDGIITVNGGNELLESVLADASLAIADESITSEKIKDGEVKTSDLADKNVTAEKLVAEGKDAGKVATVNADGTVTYQTISAGSLVDSKKVTTDGIITVNGGNELLESVLADASLAIADESITSEKIKDGEVKTSDLADKNVTAEKLVAEG